MKIRTDFVTNSSSSSFVVAYVYTKDGLCYHGEYNSGNNSMCGDEDFNPSKKFFEELKSGEELVEAMREWFAQTFSDPSLPEEYDYSFGNLDKIRELDIADIEKIKVSSMIDYEEEAYGSDITYDYITKKRKREKTGFSYDDY